MPGLRALYSAAFMRAGFSARVVFDSVPGNGAYHSAPDLRSLRSVGS